MRHIGVDLHKTNFVACFLAADDTQRLETYPLSPDGIARFRRHLRKADEVAVACGCKLSFGGSGFGYCPTSCAAKVGTGSLSNPLTPTGHNSGSASSAPDVG